MKDVGFCPTCSDTRITRNAVRSSGLIQYHCKNCGKRFVIEVLRTDTRKESIRRLTRERIQYAELHG